MSEQNNGGGLLKGILIGAAIGAGLALLYAPRSGKDTRKLLAGKVDDLKDQVGSLLNQGRSAVASKAHEIGDALGETATTHRHKHSA